MKFISKLFLGIVVIPFSAAYLFFFVYGFILGQKPMEIKIENSYIGLLQLVIAAAISLLFTCWVTIPGSLIAVLFSNFETSKIAEFFLICLGGVYGVMCGILISYSHLGEKYALFLAVEGFIFGFIYLYICKNFGRKPTNAI